MKNPAVRLVLNFLIIGVLVLLFRNLGWISFDSPPQLITHPTGNHLLIAGVIGVQMLIIGEFLEFFYKVSKIATLGATKLVYPIYYIVAGYLKLLVPTFYLVGWYSHTYNFLPVLVISIAIGLIRIPKGKK